MGMSLLGSIGGVSAPTQASKNIGVPPEELEPLFEGAEHYVEIWEKAREIGKQMAAE